MTRKGGVVARRSFREDTPSAPAGGGRGRPAKPPPLAYFRHFPHLARLPAFPRSWRHGPGNGPCMVAVRPAPRSGGAGEARAPFFLSRSEPAGSEVLKKPCFGNGRYGGSRGDGGGDGFVGTTLSTWLSGPPWLSFCRMVTIRTDAGASDRHGGLSLQTQPPLPPLVRGV